MNHLSELLEPLAVWFRNLNIPAPITHWGHPLMMGIVIFVMGGYVVFAGWRGRLASDKEVTLRSRADHRKLAPFMFLFLALGYTGGILSLVIQQEPIMESSHFWTGTAALGLLLSNSLLSLSGFWGDKSTLRTLHAYLGTAAFGLLIVHTILGVKLGLSI